MDPNSEDVSFDETPTHIAAQKATTTPPAGPLQDGSCRPVVAEPLLPQVPAVLPAKNKIQVLADERGVLMGATFDEQYRLATAYSVSGLMPQALNTPEKVLVALQLCRELGLPPMSSVSKIAVINGSPALFGDLPLALVMRSGLLEAIDEVVKNKDGQAIHDSGEKGSDPFVATCTVKRKGMTAVTRTFSRQDAERAGLWGKRVWAPYPKRMMQMRARSHALKDAFPDILMGAGILEYDHDTMADEAGMPIDVPRKSLADELNATYLPKPEATQ